MITGKGRMRGRMRCKECQRHQGAVQMTHDACTTRRTRGRHEGANIDTGERKNATLGKEGGRRAEARPISQLSAVLFDDTFMGSQKSCSDPISSYLVHRPSSARISH